MFGFKKKKDIFNNISFFTINLIKVDNWNSLTIYDKVINISGQINNVMKTTAK